VLLPRQFVTPRCDFASMTKRVWRVISCEWEERFWADFSVVKIGFFERVFGMGRQGRGI